MLVSFKNTAFTKTQKTSTYRHKVVMCCKNINISTIIDKRKELDKLRIERIKEIGNTLDHIAKSEIKQTVEIFSEIFPFMSKMYKATDEKKQE